MLINNLHFWFNSIFYLLINEQEIQFEFLLDKVGPLNIIFGNEESFFDSSYLFRIVIPVDIQAIIGKKEIPQKKL